MHNTDRTIPEPSLWACEASQPMPCLVLPERHEGSLLREVRMIAVGPPLPTHHDQAPLPCALPQAIAGDAKRRTPIP